VLPSQVLYNDKQMTGLIFQQAVSIASSFTPSPSRMQHSIYGMLHRTTVQNLACKSKQMVKSIPNVSLVGMYLFHFFRLQCYAKHNIRPIAID